MKINKIITLIMLIMVFLITGCDPKDYASFLASIFYPVREGWTALTTNAVEALTGHAPRALQTYIDDHIALFK